MMKNRAIALIITAFLGTGVAIYNFTDNDVILESGEKIEATTLPKHLSKKYAERKADGKFEIITHHTAGNKHQTVESIAKDQIKRGFAEFAYHFAIYDDGSLYVVNDIEEITWHDSGNNKNTIGIVFVGNYENYMLSQKAYNTYVLLTDILCKQLKVTSIKGHRDTSATLCPGTYAYQQLNNIFY